jgi:putative transposase
LTFCTYQRRRVFFEKPAVDRFVTQLLRSAADERFAILAYCFMPDHLHVLAEGVDESSDLRAFVHRWKQASEFAWRRQTGDQLWQRGYYEHVLRSNEDVFALARYLIANPLRAGLVRDVLDYPFIGSQTMALRDLVESVQIPSR